MPYLPEEAMESFRSHHGMSTGAMLAAAGLSRLGPLPGVHLRQSTKIEAAHVVKRADGIRMASGARLAFDLAADLSAIDHRSVVEQLLNDGKCTMATLGRMGATMTHPARPGSARFIATLLGRCGRALDSHPEVLVAEQLRARGVPVVAQFEPLTSPAAGRFGSILRSRL